MTEYQYGIVHRANSLNNLHRGPMTEEQAHRWIDEFVADGGTDDAFFVVRRLVSNWEREH